jgi:hypothetical protein
MRDWETSFSGQVEVHREVTSKPFACPLFDQRVVTQIWAMTYLIHQERFLEIYTPFSLWEKGWG